MHPRHKHSQIWLADPRYITWREQGSWRNELRESCFTYSWIPWHHQNTAWSCIYTYNDFNAKGSPHRWLHPMSVWITLNTQDWWGLIHCKKKLFNLRENVFSNVQGGHISKRKFPIEIPLILGNYFQCTFIYFICKNTWNNCKFYDHCSEWP